MVTEPADPQIDYWADNLEEELIEVGMEAPQAKAFARAFQLGMTRVLSQTATKADLTVLATKEQLQMTREDLQRGLDQLREDLHRGLDQLRAEFHCDFDEFRADIDRRFRTLYWIMAIGFSGMFALMAAILARL